MVGHRHFLRDSGPPRYQDLSRLVFLLAGVACLAGCGSGTVGREKKPTFPVTGSVFASGKPLVGAIVTLHPAGATSTPNSWGYGYPRAVVQADGKFVASTYADADGAPAGDYVLLIQLLAPCAEPPEGDDPDADLDDDQKASPPLCDKFQGQYSQPTLSKWKATVENQPLEIPRIDL